MTKRFISLANSFKVGGRCLAGIEIDCKNNPIFENGRPKWIRPISKSEHGEIVNHLVDKIKIFDIVEIFVSGYSKELSYQSENVYFDEKSIKVVGQSDRNSIDCLCDKTHLIFGNKGKAICKEEINKQPYSLMLIKTSNFEIIEKIYDENPEHPKKRLVFLYEDNRYDLPITDPEFLFKYQKNQNILDEFKELYVVVSIGISWEDWFYKLAAGIIGIKN